MSATKPQPAVRDCTPQDFATLRARAAEELARVDGLIRGHEEQVRAAFTADAERGEALAQAVMVNAYALRTTGNGLAELAQALRDAAIAEAAGAGQQRRAYERGRADERAAAGRHRKARGGDRPLLFPVKGGLSGVAVLGAMRAGRHGMAVKVTSVAATAAAVTGLSAAGMHHLDDEDGWTAPARVAVMPSATFPMSSSVPITGPPQGRHARPEERDKATVLAAPDPASAPAPVVTAPPPSPPPSSQDSTSQSGSGQNDTSQQGGWQGDNGQGNGSQQDGGSHGNHYGWQHQDQGNQWSHGDHQGHGNNPDKWNNQGNGWQSNADGSWTYQDSSGQGHGNGNGQGQGNGGGHGNGHGH